MTASPASLGRIVWIELRDPQGENPKLRPAVILTPTPNILEGSKVLIAAISSQIDYAPEHSIELPWEPNRPHPKTRLKERSVVVCNWLATVSLSQVREYAGVVPGKQLAEVLAKVNALEKS